MTIRTPETVLITEAIKKEPEFENVCQRLKIFSAAGEKFRDDPVMVTGLSDTPTAAFICACTEDSGVNPEGRCSIICVPEEKTAYALERLLSSITDGVYVFSCRDYVFHNISASSREFEHERLAVLRACSEGRAKFVICVPEALLGLLPPKDKALSGITLSVGDEYSTEELSRNLVEFGYSKADTVEGTGQFAQRGDIFDIFSPGMEQPIRLEFFGDEIDCAGTFDVMTQRRIENVSEIAVTPAREVMPTKEDKARISEEINRLVLALERRRMIAEKGEDKLRAMHLEDSIKRLRAEGDALENGTLACLDKYSHCIEGERTTLFDYASGCIFVVDYPSVKRRFESYEQQLGESLASLAESGEINLKNAKFCRELECLTLRMRERPSVLCSYFSQSSGLKFSGIYNFRTKASPTFTKDMDILCEDLDDYRDRGFRTVILAGSLHSATVLNSSLSDRNIPSVLVSAKELTDDKIGYGHVFVSYKSDDAPFFEGFELTDSKFVIFAEGQGIGSSSRGTKKSGSKHSGGQKILSYNDLSAGDYVVHDAHGIGRYEGLTTITSPDGVKRDFITLTYSDGAQLHVPADSLDRVSRYASAGETVKLSKMGGTEWQKTKIKVKRAAKDMAKELIELYAQRKRLPGHAFLEDGEWQRDFEAKFRYEETPGQLSAIADIKRDMEESYPMDRLLCGDVGFGKTEVALRAVFKCIAEGKQAAILVPTTILALQHYQTALERFCDFPANIEMISRFKTNKEIKAIIAKLKTGEVDIVIGTHRLLSKDIVFKDLGLLVVDEEQRFGVAHKEKLKQLTRNVDVLTLTATPIPRTLNMAMAGIRDMSVLEEAPTDRHPVQTYVMEHDYEVIGEAVKRELRRGGQVFYLRNKVEGIEGVASAIRRMVPDANIAVAHGQMDEDDISDIWKRLCGGEIDVLVCTTIIETGVDVPNANTLIIENSDRLGLSQLHQIRGRVGRSSRRAYAYFTYDGSKALSEVAQKRLAAIREFTEFGSGFKIAMRDLEIRGAGNLLGAEQSGHMISVGYDLFIRLLEEAVLEEKGIGIEKKCDCTVDLGISAYIPEKYISLPGARIEAYKKIAAIDSPKDADEVIDELLDRYGDIPDVTSALITISKIRAGGEKARFTRIEKRQGRLNVYAEKQDREKLREMSAVFKRDMLYSAESNLYSIKLSAENDIESVLLKIFNIYSPNKA